MNAGIRMHDVVALLEDTPAKHFQNGRPLLLRRGQVGTVVMNYDGNAFEVEFAAPDGIAYAMLPLKSEKLMVLHHQPELAKA